MKRKSRPPQSWDDAASKLRFAKPQFRASLDAQIDTSSMPHRKIHPKRDRAYLDWLYFQRCAIEGRTNARTMIRHVCFSYEMAAGHFASDPAHPALSYSGRLKHDDTQCIPLCRGAHREETGNARRFDDDYGIDRLFLAAMYYERFTKERS